MVESIYIPLTENVLLEYTYGSESNTADFGVDSFRIADVMGEKQLLNPDRFEDGEGGEYTNNVRSRSVVRVERNRANKFAWGGVSENGADWIASEGQENGISLTDEFDITSSTAADGSLDEGVLYDRARLHFTTGFDFAANEGFILQLSFKDNDGNRILLANHLHYSNLHDEELNPKPMVHGEKLYDTYIDVQVPGLDNMISEYTRVESNYPESEREDKSLLHRLTRAGVSKYQYIQVQFAELQSVERVSALMRNHPEYVEEGQDYLYLYTINAANASLPLRKSSADIGVDIRESDEGDYFEFRGLYKGRSIRNYIRDLNARGGNYILIYDVRVLEETDNGPVESAAHTIYQTEHFGQPTTFRPIIQDPSAVGLTLEVTIRMFDRTSTKQFVRSGRMTLTEAADGVVQKYGPYQNIIDLSGDWENFALQKTDIYNLNPASQLVSLPDTLNDALIGSQVKYVHKFHDVHNLVLRQENVSIDPEGNVSNSRSADITELYGQENGTIVLDQETNYFRLVFYDRAGGQYLRKNLSNRGGFELVIGDRNDGMRYDERDVPGTDLSKGELLFKIPENDTDMLREIAEGTDRFVVVNNSGGERTVMYRGRFKFSDQVTPAEEPDNGNAAELDEARRRISELEDEVNKLEDERDGLRDTLGATKDELGKYKAVASELARKDDQTLQEDFISPGYREDDYPGPSSPNIDN